MNDKHDRGGATNKGVTFATWKKYCAKNGKTASVESLKKMTNDEWGEIFKEMYWDRCMADRIGDQNIANILVDWMWCSGIWAIKHVQKIVGVKADGIVGCKTIGAINGQADITLFGKIKKDRIGFVEAIVRRNPAQGRFLRGWKNRINAINYDQINML